MSRSLRVSEALFAAASTAGAAMSRSAAQQVEHWARLGRSLEVRGLSIPQALALLDEQAASAEERMWADKRARQASDHLRVEEGRAHYGDTHWIDADQARRAKVLDGPF